MTLLNTLRSKWQRFSERFWENARRQNMEDAGRKYKLYQPYLEGLVLDFGCGEGSFLEYLRRNTEHPVLGVDVAMNSWYDFERIKYDGHRIPLRDHSVDCSTANFVLHHTPDPEKALAEMLRVTRKHVILLEDMPTTAWENFVLHFMHVVFDVFMLILSKFSTFEWGTDFVYRFRTDREWKAIFERQRARLVKEIDMRTDYPVPFKVYVLAPELPEAG